MPSALVPTVIDPTSRGERAFDLFSRLLNERIVFLGSEIDDVVANVVVGQLLHLAAESPADIRLYINSPGGSVTAGNAIYDTMQAIQPDVQTYCLGQAASYAALLLTAGARGKRFCLPNARVLLHQPHISGLGGQAADVEIHAREIVRARRQAEQLFAHHTGQPIETLRRDMDRDFILSAEEAVAYGLVDEVLPPAAVG